MHFSFPLALILFLIFPVVIWLGWPEGGVRRTRQWVSLSIRMLLLSLLMLAAAGLAVEHRSNRLAVVFAIDLSDSIPTLEAEAALDIVQEASRSIGPDDEMAVIVFGEEALVERGLSNAGAPERILSIPKGGHTDLEEAIRLAQAILPIDRAGRLVLISDFRETTGDGLQAAVNAANAGIDVVLYPIDPDPSAEVLIAQVQAPPNVLEGENLTLEVTLWSSIAQPGTIEVFTDSLPPQQASINLSEGFGVYQINIPPPDTGFVRFSVQVSAAQDRYPQNNQSSAFTIVAGGPRILVVAPRPGELMPAGTSVRPDEYSALVEIFETARYQVQVLSPGSVPSSPIELTGYAAVVLVDVPARRLSNNQMGALKSYVEEFGGGLVLVGGPTSFGIGGYFDTPLEEVSPVAMQIQDEERRSALSMLFIIDKSGSMADRTAGFSKLDLAIEATLRSVELMLPNDRLGVVAFDENATWVVPLGNVGDAAEARQAISGLTADGGTDILAGLAAMADRLPADPSLVKHVVLLTDGGADPTGIIDLVEGVFQEHGISVSAVGVGADAAPFLPDIALAGGGRYHFADHPSSIPSIFTEETILASRAYLVEESFFPIQTGLSPILSGITSLPPLHGYVATSPKQVARLILAAENGDPILATWRFGIGKAAAFTSDATGRWARDWIGWEQFGSFWTQTIRWVLRPPAISRTRMMVSPAGESSQINLDAANEDGEFLNRYEFSARIFAPDQTLTSVDLPQTGPGKYAANFAPELPGAYLFQIEGGPKDAEGVPISETFGWVNDYPFEYRTITSQRNAVVEFLEVPGVRAAPTSPTELFKQDLRPPSARIPVQNWLLLAVALLLPIDIAVRRLDLDLPRLFAKIGGRWQARSKQRAAALEPQPQRRLDALRAAKLRAHEEIVQPELAGPEEPTGPVQSAEILPEAQTPSPTTRSGEDQEPESESTAAKLLASKRARDK